MAFPPNLIYSPGSGDTLTAAQYVAEHQSRINENIPEDIDDFSATVAEMQTQTDPGESGTESVATSLSEEIARIRFAIKDMKSVFNSGISYWYETPTARTVVHNLDADTLTVFADVTSFSNAIIHAKTDEETDGSFSYFKGTADIDGTPTVAIEIDALGRVISKANKLNLTPDVSSKSADYTVTDIDKINTILMTTSNTDRTVTLPTAADNTHRILHIKKVDSGTGEVVLDGENAETIDGDTTVTLTGQNSSITIQCDGSNWKVLSRWVPNIKYAAESADYTVTDSDNRRTIGVTTSNTNRTITLPTVADNANRSITIKKLDSGTGQVIVDGEGAETIDGGATFILTEQNEAITLLSTGAAWIITEKVNGNRSVVIYNTGAGHGSTNTRIRRIETSQETVGNCATFASSSTAGTSFTINGSGVYKITYWDQSPAGGGTSIGISLNSAELTTNITGIAVANMLALQANSAANGPLLCTWVGRLVAGDVVRPHTDTGPTATAQNRTTFHVEKIGL